MYSESSLRASDLITRDIRHDIGFSFDRADLLYALCVLIALNNNSKSSGKGLMVALSAAATLFKEQGIMLLPMVVAQDILCHHRLRIRKESPHRRKFHIKVNDFDSLKVKQDFMHDILPNMHGSSPHFRENQNSKKISS